MVVWCSTLHFGDILSCSQRTYSLSDYSESKHLFVKAAITPFVVVVFWPFGVRTSQNTEYHTQVISVWPVKANVANVFTNSWLFTHAANAATLICSHVSGNLTNLQLLFSLELCFGLHQPRYLASSEEGLKQVKLPALHPQR